MLDLSIVNSPLAEVDSLRIVTEYNRLVGAKVSLESFARWTQSSPAGPAVHAILRDSGSGVIEGHMCLFPFPIVINGRIQIAAKAEYFFITEYSRNQRINGREANSLPLAIHLLRDLYRAGLNENNFDPIFVSAPTQVMKVHQLAGVKPTIISLNENLLILRPLAAFSSLPNISQKQKCALLACGLAQRSLVSIRSSFWGAQNNDFFHYCNTEQDPSNCNSPWTTSLDFLNWRYPKSDFHTFHDSTCEQFLATSKPQPQQFLRVLQWNLSKDRKNLVEISKGLIRQALEHNCLGVRWSLYDRDELKSQIGAILRNLGFIAPQRFRPLGVLSQNKTFSTDILSKLSLSDMLFSFDS